MVIGQAQTVVHLLHVADGTSSGRALPLFRSHHLPPCNQAVCALYSEDSCQRLTHATMSPCHYATEQASLLVIAVCALRKIFLSNTKFTNH